MNTQQDTRKPNANAINQLVIDGLLLENRELLDRVLDLEADNAALRETLRASVAMLHTLQEQNARLRICMRRNLWDTYGRITERRRAA